MYIKHARKYKAKAKFIEARLNFELCTGTLVAIIEKVNFPEGILRHVEVIGNHINMTPQDEKGALLK